MKAFQKTNSKVQKTLQFLVCNYVKNYTIFNGVWDGLLTVAIVLSGSSDVEGGPKGLVPPSISVAPFSTHTQYTKIVLCTASRTMSRTFSVSLLVMSFVLHLTFFSLLVMSFVFHLTFFQKLKRLLFSIIFFLITGNEIGLASEFLLKTSKELCFPSYFLSLLVMSFVFILVSSFFW